MQSRQDTDPFDICDHFIDVYSDIRLLWTGRFFFIDARRVV